MEGGSVSGTHTSRSIIGSCGDAEARIDIGPWAPAMASESSHTNCAKVIESVIVAFAVSLSTIIFGPVPALFIAKDGKWKSRSNMLYVF